jgi:hypothetical protein
VKFLKLIRRENALWNISSYKLDVNFHFLSVLIMNSEQLFLSLQFLNNRRGNVFSIGVYAADTLPKKYSKPAAFIANTDEQGKPGTHWVAIFIPKAGKSEYFDSYGLSPFVKSHLSFLNKENWTYNKIEMQSLTSNVCGHYCLMFLASRMNGHTLKSFQSLFTKDLFANDLQVLTCSKKVLKHLRLSTCSQSGGQYCCAKGC